MLINFESHATSTDNEAGLSSGWNDVDLSDFGYDNCRDLRLRYEDDLPDAVYCSDLIRSYKTGVIAFEGTGVPIFIDKRLRECDFGDLTQSPKAEVESQRTKRIDRPFPNGESYMDTLERMGEFILDLCESGYENVVIIGHRATQYGLQVHIDGERIQDVLTAPWSWQPGWKYKIGNLTRDD